jgi:hypothetical protein
LIDHRNQPIDKKILETVVALNVHNFHTTVSCEGHFGVNMPVPWVQMDVRPYPNEERRGELKLVKRLRKKYGIKKDSSREEMVPYREELIRALDSLPESRGFKLWKQRLHIEYLRLLALIVEYYGQFPIQVGSNVLKAHCSPHQIHLSLAHPDMQINREIFSKMTVRERRAFEKRLAQNQVDMQKFASFLKEKFLSGK